MNGVDIGHLIRNTYHNDTVSIAYISWEEKYSMQLFEIRPLNFLVKPLTYDKIENIVKTFLKLAKLLSGEFTYKKGHDNFKLQVREIIYLENRERKVIVHLVGGRQEEFYGSLKEAYNEQLKHMDFLFIHASYVINYDFISTVKFKQLFLTDSLTPLPISPNRRKEVRENFFAIMARRRL
jgi:DNA-binding LytR/AlgR family response regulator